MKDYKQYFRQLGIKEDTRDSKSNYEEIDPEELEMGTEDEAKEHGFPPKKAEKVAKDHLKDKDAYYTGVKKAEKMGMMTKTELDDMDNDINGRGTDSVKDTLMSPTVKTPPVLGLAVRGSSTGGLPSGIDQTGDGKLGGYTPIPTKKNNSVEVDKTPSKGEGNSSEEGDYSDPSVGLLSLKSLMPKNIEISVDEASKDTDAKPEGSKGSKKEIILGRLKELHDKLSSQRELSAKESADLDKIKAVMEKCK